MIHAGKPKGLTRAQKLRNRSERSRKEIERGWKKAQYELVTQQSMIRSLTTFGREQAVRKARKESIMDAAIDQFLASIEKSEDDEDEDAEVSVESAGHE